MTIVVGEQPQMRSAKRVVIRQLSFEMARGETRAIDSAEASPFG